MNKILATMILGGLTLSSSQAYNLLQLDIAGGTWVNNSDLNEQSTEITANSFTLQALLDYSKTKLPPLGGYYISAAILPTNTRLQENFGSFSITLNGNTQVFNAQNMVYGTPPVDSLDVDYSEGLMDPNFNDPHDLPGHGVFETSYAQVGFTFSTSNRTTPYDSGGNGANLVDDPTNTAQMLYQEFVIDISNLADGFDIHFDLYHVNASGKLDAKAPFSHDANGGNPPNEVPEGGSTLVLLSAGLFGLAFARRRFAN